MQEKNLKAHPVPLIKPVQSKDQRLVDAAYFKESDEAEEIFPSILAPDPRTYHTLSRDLPDTLEG